MLSIIISTIDEVRVDGPLFFTSSEEVELIIIDSKWSESRKKNLEQIPNTFKRIIYAPPKHREQKMNYDFISSLNTGLGYASEPFCMTMGLNDEFKPDFFSRAKEDIMFFGESCAIRPLELEDGLGDTKWNSYVNSPKRYFFLPCEPLGKTGPRSILSVITCGFVIMHRDRWYEFNGFDERYDVGCGWYDNELFDRIWMKGIPFIFDQELMIYRHPHTSSFSKSGRDECREIYFSTERIFCAPNSFDLKALHEELKDKKEEYIL